MDPSCTLPASQPHSRRPCSLLSLPAELLVQILELTPPPTILARQLPPHYNSYTLIHPLITPIAQSLAWRHLVLENERQIASALASPICGTYPTNTLVVKLRDGDRNATMGNCMAGDSITGTSLMELVPQLHGLRTLALVDAVQVPAVLLALPTLHSTSAPSR